MPDAALACAERQFTDILDAATPDIDIDLSFFCLPGIPRGEAGEAHLARRGYRPAMDLGNEDLDALIVTGTEPKQQCLRNETYWSALAELFDWIDCAGPSTVFSCLAAHAAVLHFDGIERERLAEKRCGLFEHAVNRTQPLAEDLPAIVRVAHSRWNEIGREALAAHGYDILTEAPDAGVDLFVKQRRELLLFHQGHPEYDSGALFREYRRDVQRFLSNSSESYPQLPQNYFDDTQVALLDRVRERAQARRSAGLLEDLSLITRMSNDNEPISPMAGMFRTWLSRIAAAKDDSLFRAVPAQTSRSLGMHT
jgi:homoserine O-succinyltransferase